MLAQESNLAPTFDERKARDKYEMHEKYETSKIKARYKPEILPEFTPAVFDASYWQERGASTCSTSGRGTILRFKVNETECILRHYRRGGLMQIFSRDCFICLPFMPSRAEKEFLLLDELAKRGLPVPRPIAFAQKKHFLFCKMDIIVEALTCSENLVELLCREKLESSQWRTVGQVIRRFHDEGVYHADLNAHNILLCESDKAQAQVYLLDFDKCELRGNLRSEKWKSANLARLHRSLQKESTLHAHFHFATDDWSVLLDGYSRRAH